MGGNNTPAEIVSDQGRTFTSELWEEFQKAMGTKPSYELVYHQQANGMVERFKPDLGASVAEMTFRSTMTIPGDLLGAPMQAELSQKEA